MTQARCEHPIVRSVVIIRRCLRCSRHLALGGAGVGQLVLVSTTALPPLLSVFGSQHKTAYTVQHSPTGTDKNYLRLVW